MTLLCWAVLGVLLSLYHPVLLYYCNRRRTITQLLQSLRPDNTEAHAWD